MSTLYKLAAVSAGLVLLAAAATTHAADIKYPTKPIRLIVPFPPGGAADPLARAHGACLGGGLQVALGADIRIAAPDAVLSVFEICWGLPPDMAGTQLLPRLVGLEVAKELTFTGRMVSGEEAVRLGLATRLADDPRAAALELAADLATKSPDALRHGKRLLNLSGTRPIAEQFLDERQTMASLIGRPNQVEATMAYFEQRPPKFT